MGGLCVFLFALLGGRLASGFPGVVIGGAVGLAFALARVPL